MCATNSRKEKSWWNKLVPTFLCFAGITFVNPINCCQNPVNTFVLLGGGNWIGFNSSFLCFLQNNYYLCDMERGLRNNNPLNIEKSKGSNPWQGEIVPSADSRFAQFKSMAYGYRAAFKLLYNYQHRYGCNRLEDFINRWAPPSENNTRAYITTVAKRSGLSDISTIDTKNGEQMCKIVSAMSYMENGVPANEQDVKDGWRLFNI